MRPLCNKVLLFLALRSHRYACHHGSKLRLCQACFVPLGNTQSPGVSGHTLDETQRLHYSYDMSSTDLGLPFPLEAIRCSVPS
jgi:hypothetical protein